MISELIKEKKYQQKAFLILPATFNTGILIGPLLGGWLQDPSHTFPKVFGPHSLFGGEEGARWLTRFPYALPNLISAAFLLGSVLLVVLCLKETHHSRKYQDDIGIKTRKIIARLLTRSRCGHDRVEYSSLGQADILDIELEPGLESDAFSKPIEKSVGKLPYSRILTRNVLATFLTHGMLAGHLGAFSNLWFLFLSTPRFDPDRPQPPDHLQQQLPLRFTGGLGLAPPTIGLAIGILGALGLCMQFGVYSRVTFRYGVVAVYRSALLAFPISYTLMPYLAVLPTSSEPPHAADGPWILLSISMLLFIVVTGRTFSLPCTQILVNNCTPHPSVLSTCHGIGQSVSAGARTLGPVVFSMLYGWGLEKGVVGIAFWLLAIESLVAFAASFLLYEGSGHEIRLEGE